MTKTKKTAEKGWVKVDVDGNLHVLTRGDRAARVEKDGGQFEVKVGRRREGPPRHWTWDTIGRFDTVEKGQEEAEKRLPKS